MAADAVKMSSPISEKDHNGSPSTGAAAAAAGPGSSDADWAAKVAELKEKLLARRKHLSASKALKTSAEPASATALTSPSVATLQSEEQQASSTIGASAPSYNMGLHVADRKTHVGNVDSQATAVEHGDEALSRKAAFSSSKPATAQSNTSSVSTSATDPSNAVNKTSKSNMTNDGTPKNHIETPIKSTRTFKVPVHTTGPATKLDQLPVHSPPTPFPKRIDPFALETLQLMQDRHDPASQPCNQPQASHCFC